MWCGSPSEMALASATLAENVPDMSEISSSAEPESLLAMHSTWQPLADVSVTEPTGARVSFIAATSSDPEDPPKEEPNTGVPTIGEPPGSPEATDAEPAPSSHGQYASGVGWVAPRTARRIPDFNTVPCCSRRMMPAHWIGTVESLPLRSHRVGHSLTNICIRVTGPEPGSTVAQIGVLNVSEPKYGLFGLRRENRPSRLSRVS